MTKSEIRMLMLAKRSKLTMHDVDIKSKRIIDQVRKDPRYLNSRVVALFYPMKEEVDLRSLLCDNKTFVFPRVEKDGIHFYPYQSEEHFKRSKFGVMEPDGDHSLDGSIDYMLTPALAISNQMYRIGYGKGYYDQFLSLHRPKTVVGVIYDFQKVDDFPFDLHDQKLDDIMWG